MWLSLMGPFVLLAIARSFGGLAAIVFLVGALGGLGFAAAAFGADSRDGADWKGAPSVDSHGDRCHPTSG